MIYSEEYICYAANQVGRSIIDLIENKWIGDIYNTYVEVIEEVLSEFGVVAEELNQERYNRLFLELISYSLGLIMPISANIFAQKAQELFPTKEGIALQDHLCFCDAVASIIEARIIDLKLDRVKELVLVKYEPEIQFGTSHKNIDCWNRIEEYVKIQLGIMREQGEEIVVFGKYIGKALDPEHYPSLEIIGIVYAKEILLDTVRELKKAFTC